MSQIQGVLMKMTILWEFLCLYNILYIYIPWRDDTISNYLQSIISALKRTRITWLLLHKMFTFKSRVKSRKCLIALYANKVSSSASVIFQPAMNIGSWNRKRNLNVCLGNVENIFFDLSTLFTWYWSIIFGTMHLRHFPFRMLIYHWYVFSPLAAFLEFLIEKITMLVSKWWTNHFTITF